MHSYTALGLLAAAWIAVLLVRGDPESFRTSFLLMIAAVLVDATDGTMARRVGVKQVTPNFDGRRLDDLTDFLTYTCLPLLLIWRAEMLPLDWSAFLCAPLLASAYGFCQVDIKTADGYFLGFPSYWNVVAFYMYVLRFPDWIALSIVLGLSVLTFVPSRYLYPSQPGLLNLVTNLLGAVWCVLLVWIAIRLPTESKPVDASTRWLCLISLSYPIYYLTFSWIISIRYWLRRR